MRAQYMPQHTACTTLALTEGQLGDNSQLRAPLWPFVRACVFSAGQLQCNLTSVHLESFTEGIHRHRDVRLATALGMVLIWNLNN